MAAAGASQPLPRLSLRRSVQVTPAAGALQLTLTSLPSSVAVTVGVGGPLHTPLPLQPFGQVLVVDHVLLLQVCALLPLQRSGTCVPPMQLPLVHDELLATMH